MNLKDSGIERDAKLDLAPPCGFGVIFVLGIITALSLSGIFEGLMNERAELIIMLVLFFVFIFGGVLLFCIKGFLRAYIVLKNLKEKYERY